MLRYSFSILVLIGCESIEVDNEMLPYFNAFKNEAKKHGVELHYKSVEVSLEIGLAERIGYLAYGQDLFSGDKRIVVDYDFWNSADEPHRELVLYHEFGHSFLCRPHAINGISVMRTPVQLDNWVSSREEMIDELFDGISC